MPSPETRDDFIHNAYFAVEGWRHPAVTCPDCGVGLILSREVDVMAVHIDWHRRLDART